MIGYVTLLWWRKCQWERFWTPRIPYIFICSFGFPFIFRNWSRRILGMSSWRFDSRDTQGNHKMNSRGGRSKAKHLRRANMDWCVFRLCFRHTILLYIFVTHPNISTHIWKFISPFRSGFFVLQKNVINAGFRHLMDVFQGHIFFQALEFRLSERWPSGSGDWEPWHQRSKTLWSLHCFLVVRTLFFGLVYLCCWVILRFLDSGRVAEERERSSGVYFPVCAEYFWASDFPVSSREAGTKLMIDGRKCHLLDPVVQRKDDLTDGEAYPTDKTDNHSIVMHQLKTEPLHEKRMAPE